MFGAAGGDEMLAKGGGGAGPKGAGGGLGEDGGNPARILHASYLTLSQVGAKRLRHHLLQLHTLLLAENMPSVMQSLHTL